MVASIRSLGEGMSSLTAATPAFFFHFVSLAERLHAAHHRLPVDVHELQILLALVLAAAFLLVYLRFTPVSLGVFVLPIVFVLGLVPAFDPGRERSGLVVNSSVWIFLHIALLLAAYAALFLSFLASLLYLVQERRLKKKSPGLRWLPPLETIDQIAHKTLLFGFPCMTAGLLIGSLVAQITIGASYFRDPKILLAFAMWLAYIGMIYIRRQSGLRGRRAVYLSSFVFLVILTVWAANQFSVVHRFTAP